MSKPREPVNPASGSAPVETPGGADGFSRRKYLGIAGLAAASAVLGIPTALSVRSCIPNALYETPRRVKLGGLDQFADGPTFVAEHRVFVFREKATFHCISARCTHLGCTVQLSQQADSADSFEFHCPCHGSKFRADGTNFAGPAPRPLDHLALEIAPDDGQLMLNAGLTTDSSWRLTV